VCHGRACNNAKRGYLARIFMPLAILRERPENTRARTGVAGVETPSSRRIRLVMQRKRERGEGGEREREEDWSCETPGLAEIREKVIGSRCVLFYHRMMKKLGMRMRPHRANVQTTLRYFSERNVPSIASHTTYRNFKGISQESQLENALCPAFRRRQAR